MARAARPPSFYVSWTHVVTALVLVWIVLALFPLWVDARLPFESEEHWHERVGHWFGHNGLVSGRVLDKQGHPYAGAPLILIQLPFKTGGTIVRRFHADDQGEYQSGGLPSGRYRVEIDLYDATRVGGLTTQAIKLANDQRQQIPDLIASVVSGRGAR